MAYAVPGRNYNEIWQVLPGDDDFVSFTPGDSFEYLVQEADNDYNLIFNLPEDITVYEDTLEAVPIGFDFEFFGNPYDTAYISANGFITFDNAMDPGCCEGQSLPNPSSPNNLIAAAWTDAYGYFGEFPYYNIYSYETVGDAPNRTFIVTFDFTDECYSTSYYGQIHLLESNHSIEIHTQNWADGSDPCNATTQGIENNTGTNSYYLAGRNANTTWDVSCCGGDMVRFIPLSSLPQADAGVSHIFHDPFCEGPALMSLLLRNFGGADIDSVQVHWTWDGIPQDPVHCNFPMPVGDIHYYVELDTQQVVYGETYELKAWTSMPNGLQDDNVINDTMTVTIGVGMQGSYTIGGTSPDFTTIQEAVDSLQAIGICDTVTMLIRPGTYTEQIIIPYIPGVFGKQIIFTAENGDSTSVIVEYNATHEDSNYVVMFNNAFEITWEKMTVNALGTFQAVVFELRNFSAANTIQHCAINGKVTTSNSYSYACIFSRAQNNDNTFANNTVSNGSFGYFHEIIPPGIIIGLQEDTEKSRGTGGGNPEDYVERTLIQGNSFLNFAKSAIRTTWTKGMQIHDNHMESTQTNVWAMHINEDLDTLSISNNTVYIPNGQYALHLSDVDPPLGHRASVYNNLFNVPGSNSTTIGTGLYNVNDLDFYHNTIRLQNNSVTAFSFYHSGGSIDSVYNNIFANTGNGPAIYTNSNFLNHYDYNNYHTHGNVLGTFGSSTYNAPDITTWQGYTGFDDHSISYNPLFVSDTNLHVRASLLNGQGSPLLSTEVDIDHETRDMSMPDPGGDEFEPVATDVAITQLLSPTLSCVAEQTIEVVLANVGADTVESVQVHWSLNGLPQDDQLFTLNLLPEGDTAHLVIGLNNFSSFQTDTLRIWTSMPNEVADLQPENDTLEAIFRLSLSGPYTIGGSSPDFATIGEAVTTLNTYHTCGPVTFRIRDGVYTEQIAIDSIPTSSSTNTITFESESLDSSAVTIQFTPPNSTKPAVFLLKGTDYVIFRHLGFKALPSTFSDVLELRYSADHITVSNCQFEGYQFGSSGVLIKCLNYGGGSDTITIENSYFLNGQQAIYLYNGGFSQHEINIHQNTFVNQRFGGLDVSFIRGLYILNNKFTSNTTSSSYKAIDLSSSDKYIEISGNDISLSSAGSGMFLDGMNYGYGDPNGTAHVFNNMIRSAGTGLGIGIWNGKRVYTSFNNVYASGSGAAIELAGGDSIYVRNNVLTSNTGRAFSSFSVTPYVLSDYNDLYSNSGDLGFWNNILYPTFAEWQMGTTFDSNSINVDPEFVSGTDLHVLADTLDGAGIPIAGISEDFDGNPRNALMPDIGADEIGANDDDAGVLAILPEMPFARGTQDVKAIVRNYGGNTITSVDIHWVLNNVPQTPITYTGSLPSLQEDTVTLGTVTFLLSTPYTIKSWTTDPNSNADLYPGNDTLVTTARYAAVSDTVTIGGTSPDVPTIADALTALSFGGVLDSVHFQLRNGTYHATLTLPQTAGMNCSTPIIFESESGNAANVVWDNQNLSSATVMLDGADGITFRKLTIKTVQANYPAVQFKNGAHCNTFKECILEGIATTNSSTSMATVYSHGSQNNNNVFLANTIKKGSYGIYWDGGYATTGARIENNTVQDAYYSGITLANSVAPIIHQNTITSATGISYFYGIYLYNCNEDARVTSNQVLLPGIRGVGILLSICNGNMTQPNLVANNFIVMGSGTSSYGIQHYYCSWSNLYYNTIRITGGAASGFPYYRTYATNVHIKNNIFDNRAGGVAMHIGANEGPLTCDFNDLYSNGTHLVYYNGTNYTDLEGWQASNFDTNSISLDPMYTSENGYTVTNAALNEAAIPVDSVSSDIEGMPRDALTPDIGCDEFEPFHDDVGILSINYPNEPFPSGLNTVFIKFSNNGLDTLTSMQVDWEVDSILQPTYIWTGLLPSAGTYDSLDIGEFDFEPYRTHTIKVWVSQPNGMTDELAINDTLVVDSLYPALEGIYTIGGVDPDFDSLSIATDVLNAGGAAGPVTFNIRTGTYLETINLTDYPGSDCNRPVIFQSESGDSTDVIITNLGINDNIVTLNGTDGVIFKHLSLQSVNPAYRNVVDYYNGAHCNQFLNNHIEGYENNSTDFNHAVIRSGTSLDTANRFAYNWIEHGSAAFYLVGNGSPSNTVIEHNLLDQNFYHGIYASSESKINILGNVILGSSASYYRGIYLEYCHGANRIEGNDIRCISADNILRLETCHGTPGTRPRIMNNFFSSNGTAGSNVFMINNCKRYDVFNNNISLLSTSPSTAFYFHTDSSLHLANNIIVNNGAGQILYGNNQTAFVSDYNNYYGTGSFGTWNNASVADLDSWKMATTQDANSMDVNPQYMSDTDLHVSNILLNGVGQSLAAVTIDIDGDVRDPMPDIGADEFDPSIANDAGVFMYIGPNAPFAPGTQPVTVALKNYGYETMTSADIRWLVNGIEQPVYHWTGSLGSALCDTVVIGNFTFAEYSDHDFILWSELPNGVADSTHINDTLAIDDQYPALSGTYTVGGVLPDFNIFIQLENALNKGGILNNVTFDIRPGTYNTQLDHPKFSKDEL
ncbi:MAG: right-handed parallel beta-helix repeat-containing protein [Saprospiraceae bacterium]|nr:right-handed parallel beta-helix repeat-containing protein [Candidatus Opimibacter skivensis]